jgi:hypothetical protein
MKLVDMGSEDGSLYKCIYCREYFPVPQLKTMILRE